MSFLFRVSGRSMEPAAREGDFVFVNRFSYLFSRPRVGETVVARLNALPLLKRIAAEKQEGKRILYWLKGDNADRSTDSRTFGWVGRSAIVGRAKVIHRTP